MRARHTEPCRNRRRRRVGDAAGAERLGLPVRGRRAATGSWPFTGATGAAPSTCPAPAAFVVCSNHISVRRPAWPSRTSSTTTATRRYFLAKAALFRVPFVGRVLRGAEQIPVYPRRGRRGPGVRPRAVEAVRAGKCVAIYPEATLTRDPDLWPMVGKTGAARVALETGCPVIPVAQWGAQELLPPYAKRPRLFPRKTMHVLAGPPVDLDDLRGQPIDADVLREATARIIGDDHRAAGGDPRRARPTRSTTRAGTAARRTGDPTRRGATMTGEGDVMTRVAVMGAGSWGTAFAMVLADAGCRRDAVGPPQPSSPTQINASTRNPDYLPDIAAARSRSGATTDAEQALARRRGRRARPALADACASNLAELGAAAPAGRGAWSA